MDRRRSWRREGLGIDERGIWDRCMGSSGGILERIMRIVKRIIVERAWIS